MLRFCGAISVALATLAPAPADAFLGPGQPALGSYHRHASSVLRQGCGAMRSPRVLGVPGGGMHARRAGGISMQVITLACSLLGVL